MPPKKRYWIPKPSPIEILFWEAAKPIIPELEKEVWIEKKYRVDFLIPSKKIIIELDGYKYHRGRDKFTKDAERERYLQLSGYQVIRFTGREINQDTRKCINDVLQFANISTTGTRKENPPPIKSKKKILGLKTWQITILGLMTISVCLILSAIIKIIN